MSKFIWVHLDNHAHVINTDRIKAMWVQGSEKVKFTIVVHTIDQDFYTKGGVFDELDNAEEFLDELKEELNKKQ